MICIPDKAKNPEHRDLFPGALEIMILQWLRLRPMHGYALVKRIILLKTSRLALRAGIASPLAALSEEAPTLPQKKPVSPSLGTREGR